MAWLNRQRLTLYPRTIAVMYLLVAMYLLSPGLLGRGLVDVTGKPIGTDFVLYWSVSKVALSGAPAPIYDLAFLSGIERSVTGVEFMLPWYYPPTLLLVVWPLALLPYLPSMLLWETATMGGFLFVLRRIAPDRVALWLALAFPATFQNFLHGQNGFVSAFLLGAGLLLLDDKPLRAGLLLGLLSVKPQLAALVPIVLIARGCWRALIGAGLSALGLALASVLAFGLSPWLAFVSHATLPMEGLAHNAAGWHKMGTAAATVLALGASFRIAMLVHGALALAVLVAVVWVWSRQRNSLALRGSALALGSLMVTPHAFAYDLTLLALPVAWLAWLGHTQGWRRGEPWVLLCAWCTPLLAPPMALLTHVQSTPLVLATVLLTVLRRAQCAPDAVVVTAPSPMPAPRPTL